MNNLPNHYKFTGKERDTETGLDYFGARYYANVAGRFMSPDWSASPSTVPNAMFENPQTLNLYLYVKDNPESLVDADGHAYAGAYENGKPHICGDDPSFCSAMAKITAEMSENRNYPAQQQMGQDPTLPTAEAPPLVSNQDKADIKTAIEFVGLVGAPELGELGVAGKALSEAGEAAKALKIEKLTSKAKELYPKLAEKAAQLHHVIPKYLGGAKDGALVKIPAAYHQLITNAFRTLAPYGKGISRTAEEVTNIVKQVYSKYPLP